MGAETGQIKEANLLAFFCVCVCVVTQRHSSACVTTTFSP